MKNGLSTGNESCAPLPKLELQEGNLARKPLPDGSDWLGTMGKALGLHDRDLVIYLVNQFSRANFRASPENCSNINALIASVAGMRPKDPMETMLLCQMMSCNTAAMRLLEKVTDTGISENSVQLYLKTAGKLFTIYTRQMEALSRYRRKGQQKMVVEHVTVKDGGQAVIGNLSGEGGGGA